MLSPLTLPYNQRPIPQCELLAHPLGWAVLYSYSKHTK
jgi:hypothetical protein